MLKDLDTFFDPDLHLPIRGKTYRVTAPTADEFEHVQELAISDSIPAAEQTAEAIKVLGDAYGEMKADGIPWPMILHAGRTAILHFGFTPDMAEVHWQMTHLGRLVDLDQIAETLAAAQSKRKRKGA
ncbi:hypothetical protein ABIC28_002038 [Rhodococcus sp. PvR044]|uniref:DUF7426 family protein n=1 Tax=Rhodococcus sp. PvR044 TaxID=3156402 RepID=UPI00339B7313